MTFTTMIFRTLRRTGLWFCLAFLATAGAAVAQNETVTFNGFAVVQGNGSAAKLDGKNAMMVANFDGAFFVETDDGPVQAGRVVCLGSVKVDLESTRQTGSGACTFSAADGATAWGEWECTGLNLIGCRGAFKLNGGTARFEGVSGGATLIWRPSYSELKNQIEGAALAKTSGVLSWRDFRIVEKPAAPK
jgi:hypothetical protein